MNEVEKGHLDRAAGFLNLAERMLREGEVWESVARSYYCVFHAATATLALLGVKRKSHHALWSAFGQSLAATGRIDPRLHRIGLDLLTHRNCCDYEYEPDIDRALAIESLENARYFLDEVRRFLEPTSTELSEPPGQP